MFGVKKLAVTALAAFTFAGLTLAMTSTVDARGRGGGFHGGFAHHGFVSDRSFHFGRGFRHDDDRFFDHDDHDRFFGRRFRDDDDRFFGHRFVFGNPWPWH